MLDVARKEGLSGTVHISTPSPAGVNSVGIAADGSVLWSENFKRESVVT